ncbi:hypothetical protein P9G84_31040 [Brevibacillus centrosporus]|uniref:hypothetical protein n=1 Tax=Brevibacillus centrosporus TaxID=54910 RepID=UPI0011442E20|nr:hypothetical protein [Brevibacillus centrosporus]MEC2133293.1 hypothetical protein [Brevibacillus centrosporus]GED34460.1 hypothetical protein BCE02nite_56010 [Brevibacillus centrosporus]
MEQEDKDRQHNSWKKRIWKFIWKDSPLPLLLEINAKLNPFDKSLNIIWFVTFLVSLVTSFRSLITVYWVVTIPIVVLAMISLIILFRRDFGKQRYIQLLLATIMMVISQEWVDLPSYLKNNYKVAEGVPSKFEFLSGRNLRYWEVIVNDVEFHIRHLDEESSDKWFVIHYLPHSKFILDYKTLTKEETTKKLRADK